MWVDICALVALHSVPHRNSNWYMYKDLMVRFTIFKFIVLYYWIKPGNTPADVHRNVVASHCGLDRSGSLEHVLPLQYRVRRSLCSHTSVYAGLLSPMQAYPYITYKRY